MRIISLLEVSDFREKLELPFRELNIFSDAKMYYTQQ